MYPASLPSFRLRTGPRQSSERGLPVWAGMFGAHTEGIEAHVDACQAYQDSTPASKVLGHPVRMADGDWTCVISFAEGGVHFVTVAKWRDGAISEECIMGVK
jgi:hypothetical protein